MEDWTEGYVADLGYTYGYYPELNPLLARLALLNAGVEAPEMLTACELGFGQGVCVNVHSAAGAAAWWGTDFNPSQANFARGCARASGAQARLYDDSFEDFARRDDIPELDFIALHGIWSWINDANRSVIVEFIRRKLKVGGVLYVSYNTYPGWAATVPLRDLVVEHADVMGNPGQGRVARIDAALSFADRLIETNPKYTKANPIVADRLKQMAKQDRHYLAHEYFNQYWEPMSFARMNTWLAPAKVSYACSANLRENIDSVNLTPQQIAMMKEIPDPVFRETVRDFCTNQQFRKDYWVKGPRPLAGLQQAALISGERVMLGVPFGDALKRLEVREGEPRLNESVYRPVMEAFSDYTPQSIGKLVPSLDSKGLKPQQVIQAVLILVSMGVLLPVQPQAASTAARETAHRLNRHLMQLARTSQDVRHLASPVTGGGVPVGRFQQLFLQARADGEKDPQKWARAVWRELALQGQRIVKDGKRIESPEDNLAQVLKEAREFEKNWAFYESLQLV